MTCHASVQRRKTCAVLGGDVRAVLHQKLHHRLVSALARYPQGSRHTIATRGFGSGGGIV